MSVEQDVYKCYYCGLRFSTSDTVVIVQPSRIDKTEVYAHNYCAPKEYIIREKGGIFDD